MLSLSSMPIKTLLKEYWLSFNLKYLTCYFLSYFQDRVVYSRHGIWSNCQKTNCKAEGAFLEECRSGNTRINQHCQEVYQKGKFGLCNFPTSLPTFLPCYMSLFHWPSTLLWRFCVCSRGRIVKSIEWESLSWYLGLTHFK